MFGQIHELTKWIETGRKALDNGGSMQTRTTLAWDISGKCQSPIHQTITARPRPQGMRPWQVRARVYDGYRRDLDLLVRCGRCAPCLRARAAKWRLRSQAELSHTQGRTWFVTLTLNPEEHFKAMCRASLRLQASGIDFDALSQEEQFAERHKEIGPEVTKWLKRVRKSYDGRLRYVLVAEPHTGKSGKGNGANLGLPHYHLLVHERDANAPLRARQLRERWSLGFSKVRLVAETDERKHATYVAKYLTKSAAARVRASVGYGQQESTSLDISVPKERSEAPPDPPKRNGATMAQSLLIPWEQLHPRDTPALGFINTPLPSRPGRKSSSRGAPPGHGPGECPF